jgi:hypothetical protein
MQADNASTTQVTLGSMTAPFSVTSHRAFRRNDAGLDDGNGRCRPVISMDVAHARRECRGIGPAVDILGIRPRIVNRQARGGALTAAANGG